MSSSERAQLWMFHFRCPLCGSAPGAVPLRSYLEGWRGADRAMVAGLLETTSAALLEVFDRTGGWPTKKVKRELERFWSVSESFAGRARTEFVSHLTRRDSHTLRYDATCVFCYTPQGSRKVDNYFTIWRDACRVQTGNLLYEVGLVLWTFISSLPRWADAATLEQLSTARGALHAAIRATRMMICPQCGRPTTSLGGGTSAPEADGACRWCSDMGGAAAGGGFGFRLSVTVSADGAPGVEVSEHDDRAAARNDRDLLPPEVTAMWDAIEAMR